MVYLAQPADYTPWLNLAGEVEDLFGPMVDVPEFQHTLMKNIRRGTALCVRQDDDHPGAVLLGGLFFSPKPPVYKISWLVVSQQCQRQGIGQRLIKKLHNFSAVHSWSVHNLLLHYSHDFKGEPVERTCNEIATLAALARDDSQIKKGEKR